MKLIRSKSFSNGIVHALQTDDGFPVEVTDTFLPYYTRATLVRGTNALTSSELGSRADRWLIGVSVQSGCPVGCKFCATGNLKRWRNLTADEIVAQVLWVISSHPELSFISAKEHKILYTRMGEPFLNIEAVKEAIRRLDLMFPGVHHYVSTIGVKGSDFSWIKGNITLQLSLHSLHSDSRDWLIPYPNKLSIAELGQIRTTSNRKTTLNLALVNDADFDIDAIDRFFDPKAFFIKLSPINTNAVSDSNLIGEGVIEGKNLQ